MRTTLYLIIHNSYFILQSKAAFQLTLTSELPEKGEKQQDSFPTVLIILLLHIPICTIAFTEIKLNKQQKILKCAKVFR